MGETATQAALRELSEEVGLEVGPEACARTSRRLSDALGLRDHSSCRVGPRDSTLTANPAEVARSKPASLSPSSSIPRCPSFAAFRKGPREVISIPLMGTNVHAPTAAVLYQLREVAIWGPQHSRGPLRTAGLRLELSAAVASSARA